MSRAILAADGLQVTLGGARLLDGASIDVAPDASLLVQGESGVGKTTLFEVLGLLRRPDAGTVWIDGRDATALAERQRAALRRDAVGIVFQDFQLVPDLTARENARLPQTHAGDADPAWIDTLFDALDVAAVADQHPETLSGGETQRVAVARALANRPQVVLADEPTGQLDPATTDRVLDLLFDARALAGTALVVVSHDPRLAGAFDERYGLCDGQLSRRPAPPE